MEQEELKNVNNKIDKTNELLFELLTIQKRQNKRQKRIAYVVLIYLTITVTYLGWTYSIFQ